jgi:CheY-like chemotaxis protein
MNQQVRMDRLRVLIVDDNAHMINIVKTILRGFGIKHFYEAKDAAEAFDLVKSEAIDLIVLDYQMDLLDGLDFIKLVRTADDSPSPFIPIIMLTAYSERRRVIAARDAGVTEFCHKPVNAQEMFRKLVSVVDHPRDFVRTSSYFGPDRRRHSTAEYGGPFRRKTDDETSGAVDSDQKNPKTGPQVLDFSGSS